MKLFEKVIYDKPICDGVINSITDWKNAGYYIKRNKTQFDIIYRPDKRKSLRSDITISNTNVIFKLLNKSFNELGYDIISNDISGSVIKYNKGDFLSKHSDLSNDFPSRMFCVIIQLNDSNDYTGGDFIYNIDDIDIKMNREIGNVLIIKPEIIHEVSMVNSGERNSMIFWILSEQIKKNKNSLI